MAGDWIKVRVWLCRDPKVIRMAEWLMKEPRFMNSVGLVPDNRAGVTRNVTVALCVTALTVTWGVARERGNRVDDDLVLDCCKISEISAISGTPFIGEAMEHVGWAKQLDSDCVSFPKFFKEHESPEDKHKRQNSERQARFRESHKVIDSNDAVTHERNVTVTHREEKRREEVKAIRPVAPDGFTRFWQAWPASERKVSKAKCLETWKRRKLDQHADEIVAHVTAMRDSKQWRDGYDPAPLTYLNQTRWEDGLPATASVEKRVAM